MLLVTTQTDCHGHVTGGVMGMGSKDKRCIMRLHLDSWYTLTVAIESRNTPTQAYRQVIDPMAAETAHYHCTTDKIISACHLQTATTSLAVQKQDAIFAPFLDRN